MVGEAGISERIIDIRIYGRGAEFIIVDLPGLVKFRLKDQPEHIENQIEQLSVKFIEKEGNYIVSMHPVTDDIANSGALKLARAADP